MNNTKIQNRDQLALKTSTLIVACFFLSGAAGLIYQIAWIRILSIVFGNTVYAVSMVVAGFLTGLALGSAYWGKKIDGYGKPLKKYIQLEVGIALSALAVTYMIFILDDFIIGLMTVESISTGTWQFARYCLVFLVLLPPTFMMGGTLPVMGRFYIRSFQNLGRGVGSLYAANTYGAMAGSFLTGFMLVPILGVQATVWVAVLLNLGVAGLLWKMGSTGEIEFNSRAEVGRSFPKQKKRAKKAAEEDREEPTERRLTPAALALFLIAASGFCTLAFEILWTRAFIVSFKSTVYLFSNLLTVFLFGMALGSHILSRWLDGIKDPLKVFGFAQVGIGILGALSIPFFASSQGFAYSLGSLFGEMNWMKDIIVMFILMAAAFIVPASLMGIAYPVICRVTTASLTSLGRDVGIVYAAGTAGGIIGSLVAGFFLLPVFGLQTGLVIVSVLALAVGYFALLNSESRKSVGWIIPVSAVIALVVFVSLAIAGTDIGIGARTKKKLVFSDEGIMGTVKIEEEWENGPLTLMVNNYQLATSGDVAVRFGHMPLLLKPDAKDVLVISLGSGITSGSVGNHPVERIECVEIVPALLDIQKHFSRDNHNIVADKRFHLTFWDGRHYVKVTKRKYDLVISDLFQPDSAGVGNLYSLEHFLNVKSKLKENGAMAQWLPLYQLSPENLKVVMRTFATAFEYVYVWSGDINSTLPSLMLYGSSKPYFVNPVELKKRFELDSVKADMIEYRDILSFLSFYVTDRDGVMSFTAGSKINTDNMPVIEYSAPKHIWKRSVDAVANFTSMINLREKVTPLIPGAENDEALSGIIDRYFEARGKILQGKVQNAKRNYNSELKYYRQAASLGSGDPFLAMAVFDLGYHYFGRRDYNTSAKLFEWTKKLNAELLESHFYLAKSYQHLGQPEKAKEAFLDLAKIRPDLAEELILK